MQITKFKHDAKREKIIITKIQIFTRDSVFINTTLLISRQVHYLLHLRYSVSVPINAGHAVDASEQVVIVCQHANVVNCIIRYELGHQGRLESTKP